MRSLWMCLCDAIDLPSALCLAQLELDSILCNEHSIFTITVFATAISIADTALSLFINVIFVYMLIASLPLLQLGCMLVEDPDVFR